MRKWFLIIFFIALVYRGAYFLNVRNHHLFINPVIDAEQHHVWAQQISQGRVLGQKPDDVFKPPLYPLLVGGIYYLGGPKIILMQVIQF